MSGKPPRAFERLVGYSDRWSAGAGDTIRFFVHSEFSVFRAQVVRVRHGDINPKGPGLRQTPIDAAVNGEYKGSRQTTHTGSYVRVDKLPALEALSAFSVFAWVYPSLPSQGEQGMIAQWSSRAASPGWGLYINGDGYLEARFSRNGRAASAIAVTRQRVCPMAWHFIIISFDSKAQRLTLRVDLLNPTPFDIRREIVDTAVDPSPPKDNGAPILIGAGHWRVDPLPHAVHCFNGKISAPGIVGIAPSRADVEHLDPVALVTSFAHMGVATWDLAHSPSERRVRDISGSGYDGVVVNRPTRAVTGHNWEARTDSFLEAPQQFNAIHFHDDDLEDARWLESLRWVIPDELPSGVYALLITAGDDRNGQSDTLPFFIRRPTGKPTSRVVVLIPTLSYLAYSNICLNVDALDSILASLVPLRNPNVESAERNYLDTLGLKSTYDCHRDGSGICHATILRPSLTSMRISNRVGSTDAPHQLSADLHLIDWLEEKQISYDLVTDHDLHREGVSLLSPYRSVLTGTHAEYWTREMLEAIEQYQQHGGRLVYLSGNGLYWVTGLDPETQTVCEVRRPNGTRSWTSMPGESRLSFTAEPGGLWALRGRAPQRYVGVGMSAQGFDRGAPYRRTPASHDARVKFIFTSIDDELIGNCPALVMTYGAAGCEIDRADCHLGTPRHALVLASSFSHSDCYLAAIEESPLQMPYRGGVTNTNVRADIVFYETPNDGAVFSVGSISFCSTLSAESYDSTTSRMLENVVRAFMAEGPLPQT